ncbi:organic cation transporter protein-like isoform X2 [Clavelina lepadiformis]|uniref:organic cation transporter protein-like isoform X2 n=1 Tax=Clavelina lepadiformis TaxID=159417 RepID=UPI004042E609
MMHSECSSASSEDIDERSKLLPREGSINFNFVLSKIGNLGRFQVCLVLVAYLVPVPAGLHMIAPVFVEYTPDSWCALPPLDNRTLFPNLTAEHLKELVIPFSNSTNEYDKCQRYNYSLTSCNPGKLDCISPYPPVSPLVTSMPCDEGHTFNNSLFNKTVVTEWGLVCDKATLKSATDSIFFVGVLLGGVIGGSLGDRFGRVPGMFMSQLGVLVLGIGCSFSPTFASYVVIRFVMAAFIQAGYLICIVYVMEITGPKWRTLVGINVQTMFAVGAVIVSLFGMRFRDWRDLQFYSSFVPALFCLLTPLLLESPMWLFSKGEDERAKNISETMAQRNGHLLSPDIWREATQTGATQETKAGSVGVVEIFTRVRMRKITIELIFLWFVCTLVYYGLSYSVGSLFVNNILMSLVEPIGYVIIIPLMDRVGRKAVIFSPLLIGGVACLISTFVNNFAKPTVGVGTLVTAMSLIGKMCVAGAFAVLANYTVELYPTVVRSTASGLTIMGARLGAAIAPFTLELRVIEPWISGTIFGILSLIAAFSSLWLPETLNKPMLTSLDEAERFYRGEKSEEDEKGC